MMKRGHEVVLMTSEPMSVEGVPEWVLGIQKHIRLVTFFSRMSHAKKLVKFYKPDVVHAHYAYGYGVLGAYTGFSPLVVTAMGNDIGISSEKSWAIRNGVKYTMKRMDLMTVKDRMAVERATELGCDPDKLMVLPSWCDTNLFTPKARSRFLRSQWWGVRDETPVILFVRPLNEEYKAGVLLDAMDEVNVVTNYGVKFLVVDRGDPWLVKAAWKRGAQVLPMIPHDRMHFYTASADISVDTYYPDPDVGGHGHGTNFTEALASGTPVVVPNRPEYSEAWMKGVTLYDKGDSKSLAEAILSLCSAKYRNNLGNLGREAVCAYASERVCLTRMEKAYTELCVR